MADAFDPYREALVVETATVFPGEFDQLPSVEKARIQTALHGSPQECSNLEYVRVHSGFCRRITVTPDDIARIGG